MKNEGNGNEKKNGKIYNFIQDKKAKAKAFVGKHMWIRDAFMLGSGALIGEMVRFSIGVAQEVSRQANDPANNVVEVPGGTITFEKTE